MLNFSYNSINNFLNHCRLSFTNSRTTVAELNLISWWQIVEFCRIVAQICWTKFAEQHLLNKICWTKLVEQNLLNNSCWTNICWTSIAEQLLNFRQNAINNLLNNCWIPEICLLNRKFKHAFSKFHQMFNNIWIH